MVNQSRLAILVQASVGLSFGCILIAWWLVLMERMMLLKRKFSPNLNYYLEIQGIAWPYGGRKHGASQR